MSGEEGQTGGGEPVERCDFCRLPIPEEPFDLPGNGHVYEFCSETCREAMESSDRVFTEYHGFRRIEPEIAAFVKQLPQGIPRNAFVLISGQAGARDSAVHAELVWRRLRRGEPAVIATFREPPGSIVQGFLTLEWNVLPYLERGQLGILDCFTDRVEDRERMFDRMNDWNGHLYRIADNATTVVRDPTDTAEVANKLDALLSAREMRDRGIVLVDSLTELGSLVQPVQAYRFVKDVRADVCKGRFVPVFAGATFSGEGGSFPHDLDYIIDGIVELELNGSIVEDALIKRVRVRKMGGVLAIPKWTAYEYTSRLGMVTFDPAEEASADPETDEEPEGGVEDERIEASEE